MDKLKLVRDDEHKWILQKNIKTKKYFINFLTVLDNQKNTINYSDILRASKRSSSYKGRSDKGTENTMGVRMSQINFYMFGYKSKYSSDFIPTPISEELLKENISHSKLFLANMFMMQYPHPNSKTNHNVDLFFGRLLIKLLLDERIENRLYTDELIYIIPFITKINESLYEEVVQEILSYRVLSNTIKLKLFRKVDNHEKLFAKLTHEMLYYYIAICEEFNVVKMTVDVNHNSGKVFSFRQGKDKTFRNTSAKRRGKHQGYIELTADIIHLAKNLMEDFPFDAETYKLGHNIFSEEELHNDMYITQSYRLLSKIAPEIYQETVIFDKLENMKLYSINSPDGKKFENALFEVFNEFDETHKATVLSGAGKTDIFCVMNINGKMNQFNVEAKSGSSGSNVNVMRIMRHLDQTNADYCLMVSPRFSRGTYLDIKSTKISTITTETLYQYCMKMLTMSNYRHLPYSFIHDIVTENPGRSLDYMIEQLSTQKIIFDI